MLLLERFEEGRRLADSRKGDAKGLHFKENVFGLDNLVAEQRLDEHAHQPHQAVLRVPVLNVFATGNAAANEQVNVFRVQETCGLVAVTVGL